MKLHVITIVLDGMLFLPAQLFTMLRLKVDWHWHIVHGAADNVLDTQWCKKPEPRLSVDGTTEFLAGLKGHPRISVYENPLWPGKTAMFNTALETIEESCVLMEIDVDEIWNPQGIEFSLHWAPGVQCARFDCNYFVGPNIVTVTPGAYGHNPGEWLRAWRFEPGMKFASHEPPRLLGVDDGAPAQCLVTGKRFDHYAYAFESQVAFKERYYGYENAVAHWWRLQANTKWPCRLKDFLPWSDDRAMADLYIKP